MIAVCPKEVYWPLIPVTLYTQLTFCAQQKLVGKVAALRVMTGEAGQKLLVAWIHDSGAEGMGKLPMIRMALGANGVAVPDQQSRFHAAVGGMAFAAGHLGMIELCGFVTFFDIIVAADAQAIFFTKEILRVIGCMRVVAGGAAV